MRVPYPLLSVLMMALILDGLSKTWTERALTAYQPVLILGQFFRFRLSYNTGIAFGLFANGRSGWLTIATGLVIFLIVIWVINTLRTDQLFPGVGWPLGLILGGALGNFIDRLFDGRITDFLDVGVGAIRWPTFNLADSFIVIGVLILIVRSFFEKNTTGAK